MTIMGLRPHGIAQSVYYDAYSNLRYKTVYLKSDSTILDTLFIVPGSEYVTDINKNCYEIDYQKATFIWRNSCTRPDTISIAYRVFQNDLFKESRLPNYFYDSNYVFGKYRHDTSDNDIVKFQELDYTGSYSRSLNMGNNQDIGLNSNFNMQINGYIMDSIKVEGAITDKNIPIQPDGNTQRIQEFDQIFIKLTKGNHKLTLGDYSLLPSSSHFLKFNKRVQGIYYQNINNKNQKLSHSMDVSGSVSKGQFARNIFQGIEGNQGPYKLSGNNGEQFLIILAGTERVFIDGMLIQRGEDRDYIIDYNTAEIIFMPRLIISKDKRIQVEFEYQDRNYLNSLIYAQSDIKLNGKLSFNLKIYSNQDAKNQSYSQLLNSEQKHFLAKIGDNIDQAYYQNIIPDTFAAHKILYKMIDTMVDGILYDSVFVVTNDSTLNLYQITFSYLGENKGDYIIANQQTNGRSYQWVAPVDGISQGKFAPVQLLIAPKKHQIISLATIYQIADDHNISMETSMSNYDPNLFSKGGQKEHLGTATKIIYSIIEKIGRSDSNQKNQTELRSAITYQFVDKSYKEIAPFRNVEFSRDFNLIGHDSMPSNEHLIQFHTQLINKDIGRTEYQFNYLSRSDFKAIKNIFELHFDRKKLKSGIAMNLMNSKSNLITTSFFRPNIYANYNIEDWDDLTLGISYQLEHNKILDNNLLHLTNSAYSFHVWQAGLQGGASEQVSYSLKYTLRQDAKPLNEAFTKKDDGHTIDLNLSIKSWADQVLEFTGGYRKLIVHDTLFAQELPNESIVGRLNYIGKIKKGFVTSNLLYDFGTGQEQKRINTFVEVPAGQGMYYWVDYNNDGVQQANEFELGLFPDQKRFIKIITPTNEYVKVNFYQLNASISLLPQVLFKDNKTIIAKFLSRFQDQFSMQLANNVLSDEGMGAFIPLNYNFADTNIISNQTSINNTLFFNRSNAKYGIDYTINLNGFKTLLNYGLESGSWLKHIIQSRYNLSKNWMLKGDYATGYRSFNSSANDGRSYNFKFTNLSPSITFILDSKWRITSAIELMNKLNDIKYGGEKARGRSLKIDSRYSMQKIGSIAFSGGVSFIDFSGEDNSSVGFNMLEGLKNGRNFLWRIAWDTKITKNVEFSLEYDARKSEKMHAIHTGRLSVRTIL